jgi:hypothetical protein
MAFPFFILFPFRSHAYQHNSGLIHQIATSIHNLKKFFAFRQLKYTLPVYKDLSQNILLSKKEINVPA